jgi:hypothetical protein
MIKNIQNNIVNIDAGRALQIITWMDLKREGRKTLCRISVHY